MLIKENVKGKPRVLHEILAYTDVSNTYDAKALNAMIETLKGLHNSQKYGTFYKLL